MSADISRLSAPQARYEVVVYRDPDDATEIHVFVDGRSAEVIEYHVDPTRGYTAEDWADTRAANLAAASPAARARLETIYAAARPELLPSYEEA